MNRIITITPFVFTLIACNKPIEENQIESIRPIENIIQLSAEQIKTIDLSTTQLQNKSIVQVLKLNGKVDAAPSDVVSVSSALGGYIKKINVLPGAHFSKGQILGVLEDNQFIQLQQDYLTTQVQLKTAELNYERQKELNQSKASSDKTLQQVEAEYRTLKISQKALEEKLRLIHLDPKTLNAGNIRSSINIYAPFSGIVSRITVNTGKYVSPSETLLELVNPRGLLLNLKAFEKDLSALKVGQELSYSTTENPLRPYQATIISIGKRVNEDGSTDVLASTKGGNLTLGMYINAEIHTTNKASQVLPESCLVMFENKWYVFEQLPNRTFKILEVHPGYKHSGYIEILNSDILSDKTIIEKGAYILLMSLKNKSEE